MFELSEKFDFNTLEKNIQQITSTHRNIECITIGNSLEGKPLYMLKIGKGKSKIFYNGAHSATEWITSCILLKFAEDLCVHSENKQPLFNSNVEWLLKNCTLYILPMVNPDGVNIAQNGPSLDSPFYDRLPRYNQGNETFDNWQANARGVDLNHNYSTGWYESKQSEFDNDILGPARKNFGGDYPKSEPEVLAICRFLSENSIQLMISLQTDGEEIYWEYSDKTPSISNYIVHRFSELSGYVAANPKGMSNSGGLMEYFIDVYRKPAFTIKVGRQNPVPISEFDDIYVRVAKILLFGCLF